MVSFLKFFFSVLLGLLPWANVLIILGDALQQNDKKKAVAPFLFLFVESYLMYMIIKRGSIESGFNSSLLLIIFILAAIYSIIYFVKNEHIIKLKSLILTCIIPFFSSWIILINIIGLYILQKANRELMKKWGAIQVVAIAISIYIIDCYYKTGDISAADIFLVFLTNTGVTMLSLSISGYLGIASNNDTINTEELKIKKTISTFFEILGAAFVYSIPWISILAFFARSVKARQKINITISLVFIIIESYLLFHLATTIPTNLDILHSFIVVSIVSSICILIVTLIHENLKITIDDFSFMALMVFTVSFGLLTWLCAQSRYIYYPLFTMVAISHLYKKKYIEVILYTSMIYFYYYFYNLGYTEFHFILVCLFATILTPILKLLEESNINSLLESKLRSLVKQLLNQSAPHTQPTHPEIISTEVEKTETVIATKPASEPKPYNKGWTVDDTIKMDIRLSSIEDMIYPLTLKNEYEKSVKGLIVYIRKLEKHTDADIKNTLGSEGLSSYLNTFFDRMKFDAVRWAYIKSLSIVLESYSKRDNRVLPYLQKLLSIKKQSE